MDAILVTVRLKSTRLEKKVLRIVDGKPILKFLTDRLKNNFNDKIIICTSTNQQDDPLIKFAEDEKLDYFRGSEEDVLERYLSACREFNADRFYIVYGDEPFTDIETMNLNFSLLNPEKEMWIKNDSLPEGTYGYGMTLKGLEYINNNKPAKDLEVWQLMADKLPIEKIELNKDKKEHYDNFRFTIDYPEDLEAFSMIINKIGEQYVNIPLTTLEKHYNELNLYKINGFRIKEYEERIVEQGSEYLKR
jgi:spore coat polysaccharide biosynthesis protein SpsF